MLDFKVCNSGKNENTHSLRVLLQFKVEISGGGKFQVDKNDINWIKKKDNDHFIFVHLLCAFTAKHPCATDYYFISLQSVQSPFTSLCFLFYVKISHFSLPAEPLIFLSLTISLKWAKFFKWKVFVSTTSLSNYAVVSGNKVTFRVISLFAYLPHPTCRCNF